ncbi:arylsulfatase [Shewanella marinintestina]|uniref:arylsulfatase n=1 Tax=Shewanella marinintestina TaxID=190305 RepID=UPI00200D26F6|nr:arylsulfatase [Shewanella marinintestina]MCL1145452.1 arylsulfatase [Shewanella marinintestina]
MAFFQNHLKKKLTAISLAASFLSCSAIAADKPNILVIWGDDIGQSNISAYTFGMMGYKTPNIDSIANEGMMFTDYYGEQSCTAGRSTFITGQSVFRTGLSKVGMPGADIGLQATDATIAEILKPMGYATGQFGKNHLGDQDKFLPTNHGFDEFFGNLYHLNAEEEPENIDYPKDPEFRKKFGPRGVIKSSADGKIEDTGPLTKKRMETVDDETVAAAIDFMERKVKAEKPFFVWWSGTRMHFRTHVKPELQGSSGLSNYADGMIEHDNHVGQLLAAVDKMGIKDNTIVFYSTDNGPHMNTWPDAGTTPFRGEKNTNWEGAYRVPAMVRWPGKIAEGSVSNDIMHHMDWLPTFAAAAGDSKVKDKLLKGHKADGKTFKNHLDGYNFLPYLTGKDMTPPREEIFYFTDDGDLAALRFKDWKLVFMEQRVEGTLLLWANPFTVLRLPKIYNLRMDPYENADITSNTYWDWMLDRAFMLVPAQAYVGKFLETFKEYPPSQKAASFSLDQVMEKLQTPPSK